MALYHFSLLSYYLPSIKFNFYPLILDFVQDLLLNFQVSVRELVKELVRELVEELVEELALV